MTKLFLFIIIFLLGLYFYAKTYDPTFVEGLTNYKVEQTCPNLLIQKGSKMYLYNSRLAEVPGVNPVEFNNLEDYTDFLKWQRSQGVRCPVLYLQQSYDTQGNEVYKVRPSVSEPQGGLPPSTIKVSPATQTVTPSYPVNGPPSITQPVGSMLPLVKPLVKLLEQTQDNTDDKKRKDPNPTLLVDAHRNDPPYNTNSMPAFDPSTYYVGRTTPLDKLDQQQESLLYSPNPMDPNWGGADYTQKLIDQGYYKDNEVRIRV